MFEREEGGSAEEDKQQQTKPKPIGTHCIRSNQSITELNPKSYVNQKNTNPKRMLDPWVSKNGGDDPAKDTLQPWLALA
jgi:hypothetical protein